jgi:hypothetical protein
MNRPTGVTILAALEIIFGAIMVLGAIALIALAGIIGVYLEELTEFQNFGPLFGAIGGILSIVLLIIAMIEFLMAWGLLGGKGWAWTVTIIFSVIAIIMGLLSLPLSLVSIAINALIIYYLFRPNVRAFFGKVPAGAYETSVQPPPPPETFQQTPACPRCGKPLTYIPQYQRWYCYDCQQYA